MKIQLKPTILELSAVLSIAATIYVWRNYYTVLPDSLRSVLTLGAITLLGIALFSGLKAYTRDGTIRLIPLLVSIMAVACMLMAVLFIAYFLIGISYCARAYGSC